MRYLPLLLLFTACATAQPRSSLVATDFFLDPVGKEYLLLSDGSLVTTNPLGQNDFAFFDSSLGRPDAVDVTNPFAVLLFYADYGRVVILDRTLSEIRRLDLFSLDGVEQPTLLARATDNGIWLFDAWDYRLKQMSQDGTITTTSNDLRLALKTRAEPAGLYVYQNLVLLHYAEDRRLGVFTNYGRFQRWVNLPEGENFTWLDGRLAGRETSVYWTFDLRTNNTSRTQVRGEVDERWLPVNEGYRRLNLKTNRTEFIEK